MADNKVTPVSPSVNVSDVLNAPTITGLVAGEDLLIAAPCKVSNDGKVYMSVATGETQYTEPVLGWTPRAVKSGEPVTLICGWARFKYASGLTPGAVLYVSSTKGRLETAATYGDNIGIAVCISSTDIMVTTRLDAAFVYVAPAG